MRYLAVIVLVACGTDFPTPKQLPRDVGTVLCARCTGCHSMPPNSGAHFPLLTWDDTHKQFGTTNLEIWQRMQQVIEPGTLPHMPPDTSPTGQPAPAELDTMRAWFAAGAPGSADGCDNCIGVIDAGVTD